MRLHHGPPLNHSLLYIIYLYWILYPLHHVPPLNPVPFKSRTFIKSRTPLQHVPSLNPPPLYGTPLYHASVHIMYLYQIQHLFTSCFPFKLRSSHGENLAQMSSPSVRREWRKALHGLYSNTQKERKRGCGDRANKYMAVDWKSQCDTADTACFGNLNCSNKSNMIEIWKDSNRLE